MTGLSLLLLGSRFASTQWGFMMHAGKAPISLWSRCLGAAIVFLSLSFVGCATTPSDDSTQGSSHDVPRLLEHKSELGFRAMIPSDWIVVDRAAIRAQPDLLQSNESIWAESGFPESTVDQIMTMIKSGNVEFYYPIPSIQPSIVENINVSKMVAVVPKSEAEAVVACSTLEDEYRAALSPAIHVHRCQMRSLESRDVFYVQTSGAQPGISTSQYFVGLPHGAVLIVTLSTSAEGVSVREAAMDELVSSIKSR